MPLTVKCSHCGKTLRVRPGDAGEAVYCQACGGRTLAPLVLDGMADLSRPLTTGLAPAPVPRAWASAPVPAAEPSQAGAPHAGMIVGAVWLVVGLAAGIGVMLLMMDSGTGPAVPAPQRPAPVAAVTPPQPTTAEEPEEDPLPAMTAPTTAPAVLVTTTAPTTRPAATQVAVEPATRRAPVATRPADPEPPAPPRRPAIRQTTPAVAGVTDQQIERAIRRGAEHLLNSFENGRLVGMDAGERSYSYYVGYDALCVYALLQCGEAIKDDRLNVRGPTMRKMIDELKRMPIEDGTATYARAVRAMALAMYNRPEDQAALRADVAWLLAAHRNGAYSYIALPRNAPIYDNSNSQYGLLGVWSGAEVGVDVPTNYWTAVEHHWAEEQLSNGQWGYGGLGHGTLSMTAAGLASLFVTHDYLDAPKYGKQVGRPPLSSLLSRGLAWFESGDNCIDLPEYHWGYTLYGIERVGLASGYKYFGTHDWYRELAAQAVARQRADGSWVGAGDTPFTLLFLARGRHPILMNKLRFDGAWANRPRDVANLARFAGYQLERPLNWQVVTLDRDWVEWTESPILYLSSHQAVSLSDADCQKLTQFVQAGGLIYTQADGDSPEFNTFAQELGRRLFPQYAWADVPPDHEIYSVQYKLNERPKLRMVSNGSRILMLHSPADLSQHWQTRAEKTQREVFEFGVNLFVYAAGKTDLRNRLASPYVPPSPLPPTMRVPVAQLRYDGDWNPEPYALTRFTRYLAYETGLGAEVRATAMSDLKFGDVKFATLTGTGAFEPTQADANALRRFVEDGGVVLIDACGGNPGFYESVGTRLLPAAFGTARPQSVFRSHPLLNDDAAGMADLTRPRLRPYAAAKAMGSSLYFEMLRHGKGAVILSPLDLTTGLLGTQSWGINGYHPTYAQEFVKNALLWTIDGAPEKPEKKAEAALR